MATRVYLNGKTIEVEKSGGSSLSILVARAKFTIIGTIPVTSIEDYTHVKIFDTISYESIIDEMTEIQDSNGASVGSTNLDIKNYLSSIIPQSDSLLNPEEGATKANQDLLIIQNALLQEELEKLNLSNEDLERIKELLKTNNKLLGKIYD